MSVRGLGLPPVPDEPRPQSPQLLLRVAILGGVAAVFVVVLFFRLWVLQILSTDRYAQAATRNIQQSVVIPAARGRIVDANGVPLVANRATNVLTYDLSRHPRTLAACGVETTGPFLTTPTPKGAVLPGVSFGRIADRRALAKLPRKRRMAILAEVHAWGARPTARPWAGCGRGDATLRRVARLTRTPLADFEDAIHAGEIRDPHQSVILLQDVAAQIVYYLREHATSFVGVAVSDQNVRTYPQGALGAQLWGQISQISQKEIDAGTYPRAVARDLVGKGGLEQHYDRPLRGTDGRLTLQVDALGHAESSGIVSQAPVAGSDLQLTLDANLQKSAQKALGDGIKLARSNGSDATAGAIVAMDPSNGAILAMASNPGFDPTKLYGPNGARYAARHHIFDSKLAPSLNRAITGLYPPGSTFKPATAIAAAEAKLFNPSSYLSCTPAITLYKQRFRNLDANVNEQMNLITALTTSCDTYFYQLGDLLYRATAQDGSRQPQAQWERRLGFGHTTGIDVAGEAAGRVVDEAYKKARYPGDPILGTFNPGDAILSAIGQGDLTTTPLQMARLYALIANGGYLVTPHLGKEIVGVDGRVVQQVPFAAPRRAGVDRSLLSTIAVGLQGVTKYPDGTAKEAFAGFSIDVAGKTGTAQKVNNVASRDDYSWFVGYAPADNPKIVVAAVIEGGGRGALAAAPAVREVMGSYFGMPQDIFKLGLTLTPAQLAAQGIGTTTAAGGAATPESTTPAVTSPATTTTSTGTTP
jgi:penicillin-binding protein 2